MDNLLIAGHDPDPPDTQGFPCVQSV